MGLDHLWSELWSGMSKTIQKKQQWTIEKPEFDKARKLRGICYVDPDDIEHKNRAEKLELAIEAAMPCKVKNHQCRETCGESDNRKSKHACIVEAHGSTRKRLERTLSKDHEDRIAGKGFNSLSHYNLVHKFIPMHQAMKIPDANTAVDEEWEKLEKLPAWPLAKVKTKREVIQEAQ